MKKRLISMLTALTLLVSSAGVMPRAAKAESLSFTGTVGTAASWTVYTGDSAADVQITSVDGTTPAGMNFVTEGSTVSLKGTPTESCTVSFTVHIKETINVPDPTPSSEATQPSSEATQPSSDATDPSESEGDVQPDALDEEPSAPSEDATEPEEPVEEEEETSSEPSEGETDEEAQPAEETEPNEDASEPAEAAEESVPAMDAQQEEPGAASEKDVTIQCSAKVDYPTATSGVYSTTMTEGSDFNVSFSMSTQTITNAEVVGTLAPGLEMTFEGGVITLKGSLKTAGDYTFSLRCFDHAANSWRVQPISLTVEALPTSAAKAPKITKNPTGETVREGESAVFIAKAENSNKVTWYMESPNGKTTYECKDAPQYFTGVVVTGYNKETLRLENIALEMNGWKVKAKFEGDGGTTWSETAELAVKKGEIKPPSIRTQPVDASLQPNEVVVLKINAVNTDAGVLTYQWYMNTTNSNSGGKSISGAITDSYTPEYIEGTTYYYCAVRCTVGNEISTAAKSTCAAVTYAPKETVPETTQPAAPAETAPPETTPPTISFTEPEEAPAAPAKKTSSIAAILFGFFVFLAVAAIGGTVIFFKFFPPDPEDLPAFLRPKNRDDIDDDEDGYAD